MTICYILLFFAVFLAILFFAPFTFLEAKPYSHATADPYFLKAREEIKNELAACKVFFYEKLVPMSAVEGVLVRVFEPDDPLWNGRAEYVAARLERLLCLTDTCLCCGRRFGMLRVGLCPLKWLGGVAYRKHDKKNKDHSAPSIILSTRTVLENLDQLDDTIAHEFAHITMCPSMDKHGDDWEFSYRKCLAELRRGR